MPNTTEIEQSAKRVHDYLDWPCLFTNKIICNLIYNQAWIYVTIYTNWILERKCLESFALYFSRLSFFLTECYYSVSFTSETVNRQASAIQQ